MLVYSDQAWVTSVVSDEDALKALVLCCSLKRSFTSRKVIAIVSAKVSGEFRKALYHEFDFLFILDEDLNMTGLALEHFAKLYGILVLSPFKTCVYVSPHMLAVRNCDDIFKEATNELVLVEEDVDASVFLFKPSLRLFKALEAGLDSWNINGCGLGPYLNKWGKNKAEGVKYLKEKFNKMVTSQKGLLGNEQDISLVNMTEHSNESRMKTLEKSGLFGKLVAVYWQKVWNDDVIPLLQRSSPTNVATLPTQVAPTYRKEPIAIVGMSCRFPGSNNLEEFWDLLFKGQDGTCSPPPFRWLRQESIRHVADTRNTNAGFLKVPVDEFDAKFFGISPKEVLSMDPQHRLLHEVIWEGLEDACIDPQVLRGSLGSVFLGSWTQDYKDIIIEEDSTEYYRTYIGNSIGAATARISFQLGLTGPSVATESGCSSAMVALHLACRSLQNGETNLALAAGVNLLLHQFDKDVMPMVFSKDGHCKTFSEDADGFARAEGCGVLVLKRLSDAMNDGDNIWGLIRGSAISQEGVSQSLGTPTVHCESLAMKEALLDANVQPEEVSYVEAHGTGTVVGDPMEIAAIASAYHSECRKDPLIIGSVKTNVGHTESCSGITGIMKVILSMMHEAIPAHLNFTKLNPDINLEAIPAIIPMEVMPWKKVQGSPRLAGVSSFGITGTDVHVIIEEPPQIQTQNILAINTDFERPLHLLKISAKTEEALEILLSKYKDTLTTTEDSLANICYSANTGRANFSSRAVVIAKTKEEAVDLIEKQKFLKKECSTLTKELAKTCFLFTGQGSQYPGMAKSLYDSSPVFQMHFDYCEKILNENYNISLKSVLWSTNSEEISRTIYSQTGIFCVEYALLKLWESWGVKPDYCLGHSLGEFAAAVCCGIICVEDAIKLVAERSKLIDSLPRGKMLVIQADYNQVQKLMKKFAGEEKRKLLDYAAVNSSQQTVVSGDSDVVMEFEQFCGGEKNNLKCLVLAATNAFHSKHMDPILGKYRDVAKTITTNNPGENCSKYISGMLGDIVRAHEIDTEYWVQHTREKVNFLSASKKAVELGCQIFIEIGPQPVLSALTMANNDVPLLCLPSLKRKENEWETILTSLGKLYLKGVHIDWQGLDQFYNRKKCRLPHYPFIGKKFWPNIMHVTGNAIHPLVGSVIPNASSVKIFQGGVSLGTHEYIKDHVIGQTAVLPGAAYLEMCLASGFSSVDGSVEELSKPSRPMKVENLMIKAPLALEEGKTCQLQTVAELNISPDNPHDWNDVSIKIFHRFENNWLGHATATFSPIPSAEELQAIAFDTEKFIKTLGTEGKEDVLYDKLASIGLMFGPVFRSVLKLWRDEENNTLLAKVKVPKEADGYILHPAVLDAMMQAITMLKISEKMKSKLYMPTKIGKFLWLSNGSQESETYIHVFEKSDNKNSSGSEEILLTTDITALLVDSKGNVLAAMSGVEFIDTTVRALQAVLEQQTSTMPDLWEESWRAKLGPSQHRHDLSLCRKEAFYDDHFHQYIEETYNKLSPEQDETLKNLEQLVYLNMLRALYKCGWTPQLGQVFKEQELLKQLEIQAERTTLFGFILRVLGEEGILEKIQQVASWKVVGVPFSLPEVEEQLSSSVFKTDLVNAFNSTTLFEKVGANYADILKGEQSALQILFPEDNEGKWPSVGDFYTDYGSYFKLIVSGTEVLRPRFKYCISHKTEPRDVIRILEVGAGTGAPSQVYIDIFEELQMEFEFTFTDISTAFFGPAEKQFEKWSKHMTYKKLNIEEDPITQGFPPNYFDYVFASEVIHATRNLSETLKHVRMLLRPGGKFVMQDMTRVSRPLTYLFGLLEGFWRFEDIELRPDHCTLTTEKWMEIFKLAEFEDVESFPVVNTIHSIFFAHKKHDKYSKLTKINPASSKTWIIFHQHESPTSNALLESIALVEGRSIVSVTRGNNFKSFENGWKFQVDPKSEGNFVQLMKTIEGHRSEIETIEGVVYCWSLDKNCKDQDSLLQPYFYMVKSVFELSQTVLPRLYVLVDGVMSLSLENDLSQFNASTIIGFTKSLRNERLDLPHCCCIDIGGKVDEVGREQVFYELWNSEKEAQICFHEATRYISRLHTFKPQLADLKLPSGSDRFQLVLPETKSISDLQFGPLEPIVLEEGEVEIQVKTSALNFRDVFSVLKPTQQFDSVNAIGFDFAGIVKRNGPNVSRWSVGDRVFGVNVNGAALPSHIKMNEKDALPVPDDMPFADACTLPAVVATSYHCLIEVAKITSNDTVLIHTASGGVGLSAIEICKSVGATVIATAGSNRKRNYLRSLGIEHVFHSRNTQYGEKILNVTNGRGVDVVLNSLTSEGFKEATLKCCAKGARFVEMSKLSVWKPEEVAELRPDVKYTIADLSSMEQQEWRRLMSTLKQLSDKKVVNPIPYVRFDGVHIREALQWLQGARHIGKVVCVIPEIRFENGNTEVYTSMFNSQATYLITGGLGGIGFVVCKWMVERGAKHVLLAGRSAPNKIMQRNINQLNSEFEAQVQAVQLDVGNFEQCKDLIQKKLPEMGSPPLRGVMHAAGTLHDGIIENQTWPTLSSTFNSKVDGTLNLHMLTKDLNLEHFVLFSSMASLFGSPGQSNHAAGNHFEDTFAFYRNSIGLPATTINWGQWGEVGVATEVELRGVKPFSNVQALTGLEFALKSHRAQTGVVYIDSFVLFCKLFPRISSMIDERVWKFHSGASGGNSIHLKTTEFWQKYDPMETIEEKLNVTKEMLGCILKHILKMDDCDIIGDNTSLQELGVDSLMFLELKNALQNLLGDRVRVNASSFRDCNTVNLLANTLVKIIEVGQLEQEKIPTPEEVTELIQEDCQLPENIKRKPNQKRINFMDISVVLLTGCTGTLGPYLLRELTKLPQISQVICLIRPAKSQSGVQRLKSILQERDIFSQVDMSKIRCVTGNVAKPNLDMDPLDWEELCNSVDSIFHCAARVQHMEHYTKRQSEVDMRAVNIGGTKNVLEFACTGTKLKHVYNASSMLAVTTLDECGRFSENWPEAHDYDGVTTKAYPITKFVADVLLKRAILERGIPGKVFRLPLILGDSKTGRFILDQNHAMLRYIFMLKHGVMPSNPFIFPMLPVDVCAWATVQIFFNENAPDDIYNISNKCPDVDQQFVEIAKRLGYKVDLVEFSNFAKKIQEEVPDEWPFAQFKDFYKTDEDLMVHYSNVPSFRYWIDDDGSDSSFFVSSKLKNIFPEFYAQCQEPTMESIYRDLCFAKNHGWFKRLDL